MNSNTINEGKTYAFVAYLTLLGTLFAFFMNREKPNSFTSFHIRQALGLGVLYLALAYVIGVFDNWMISISFMGFFFVLYLYGIAGALSGKLNKLPLLGDLFQNIFKSVGQR